MKTPDQIKIRTLLLKLKRLSHSPNKHEAARAQERYDAISQRTGIVITDEDEHPSGMKEKLIELKKFRMQHRLAGLIVMNEHGVQVIIIEPMNRRMPRRLISLIGEPAVLEPAAALFIHLVEAFEEGWEWFKDAPITTSAGCYWCKGRGCIHCPPKVPIAKDRRSFLTGMYEAIDCRFYTAREQRKPRSPIAEIMALINGEPSEAQWEEAPHGRALAVADQAPATKDKIEAYAGEAYPQLEKDRTIPETMKLSYESAESHKEGQRRGLTIALSNLPTLHL